MHAAAVYIPADSDAQLADLHIKRINMSRFTSLE